MVTLEDKCSALGLFPTNPINALEARSFLRNPGSAYEPFPTNPINALEASVDGLYGKVYADRFPTNPINALEARDPGEVLVPPERDVSN